MIKKLTQTITLVACLGFGASANAGFISFDSIPTDTSYISSGLLLGSNTGNYVIGGCDNQTPGSNGCLGDSGSFTGVLDFTFVELNTTIQAMTDSLEIILCEGCAFRGSSATVFDPFGGILTTIDMNTASGIGNRTFNYVSAGIGSIRVDLGSGADAVQSLEFGSISSTVPTVPEPATLALFGIGLAGLGFARKKKKSA